MWITYTGTKKQQMIFILQILSEVVYKLYNQDLVVCTLKSPLLAKATSCTQTKNTSNNNKRRPITTA